jgi:hypothetical protein
MTPEKVPLGYLGGIMGILGLGLLTRYAEDDQNFKWKVAFAVIGVLIIITGALIKYGIDNILKGQDTLTAQVTPLCAAVAVINTKQETMSKDNERLWNRVYNIETNQSLPTFKDRLKAINGTK